MANSPEKNKGIKTVLANPDFRRLWIGQTISQVGDGLTNLALLIVINRLTGSTAALATMMVVIALPQLVFGLISGVFVDRWNRKQIMVISDIVRGLLVLGFILVRRPGDVWIFYLLGFLQAAVGTFFGPAKSAMIPTLVEPEALLSANALSQTTQVVTGVVGSALAGVLVGVLGAAWPAFTLDALSFFVSAVFISRITVSGQVAVKAGPAQAGGVRQTVAQLVEGLRYLAGRRILVGTMMTFAVTMLGMGAVNVLIIPFLVNLLRVPTTALGVIDAAQGIGMVLGTGLVAALAARFKAPRIITWGIILIGLFVALFGASQATWMVLVSLFFIGLFLTPVQAAASTLFQTMIPNDKRGRTGAAMNTVITLASVISMGLSGVLGDALGVRQVFYLSGSVIVAAGLLAAVLMRTPAGANEDPGFAITGEKEGVAAP